VPRVFAYGSLMGDAVLSRYNARPARLEGFHRAFRHESKRRWGTPDGPCPVVGLSPGGECWGVAFDIPEDDKRIVLRALDKREAADERQRETRNVETPDGNLEAWVWVSRGDNGNSPNLETLEASFRVAHGAVGTGSEYVRTMVHAMEFHGIRDSLVDTLWERLRG
jgi:cation transport protein ChaC